MSNIMLKSEMYTGSITSVLFLIYSFNSLSFAEFSTLIHFSISPSVMDELIISSSVMSMFISSCK